MGGMYTYVGSNEGLSKATSGFLFLKQANA